MPFSWFTIKVPYAGRDGRAQEVIMKELFANTLRDTFIDATAFVVIIVVFFLAFCLFVLVVASADDILVTIAREVYVLRRTRKLRAQAKYRVRYAKKQARKHFNELRKEQLAENDVERELA